MGYTPNPALLSIFFTLLLALLVTSQPAVVPSLPTVSAGGFAQTPGLSSCGAPGPISSTIDAPTAFVTQVSTTFNYVGSAVTIRNVLPYQIYGFDYSCGGLVNMHVQVFYIFDGADNFVTEYRSCANSPRYGSTAYRFYVKPNNAAIRQIKVVFWDDDVNAACKDITMTHVDPSPYTLNVYLMDTCNSGSNDLATFEPTAIYSGPANSKPIIPDSLYLNDFIGCPNGYIHSTPTSSIVWQLDGTAAGYQGVSLRFLTFNLRNGDDYVIIYQGAIKSTTTVVYKFTGTIPPGSEEVYIEDPIITIELASTKALNSVDPLTFPGFLAVFNWNNPCKVFSNSPNNYVSYLPFDHLGCTNDNPASLQTNFRYYPLNFYGQNDRSINFVFTDFDLDSNSKVETFSLTSTTANTAFTPTLVFSYPGSITAFTIPASNTFGNGIFAQFTLSVSSGPRIGYGASFDVGYVPTGTASLCSLLNGGMNSNPPKLFSFYYDTPSASLPVASALTCNAIDMPYRSRAFYVLRPSSSFTNSLISFAISYQLPEQTVSIYDGPSLQYPKLQDLFGYNCYNLANRACDKTYSDISSGSEVLFVFEDSCVSSCVPAYFSLSYTLPTDICHGTGGKSVNQFPLATIGCPEGIASGLHSYWLISGEKLSRGVNIAQQGVITVSFTFFDIGANILIIRDGDAIYEYLNGLQINQLHVVGQYTGSTFPPAFESTQPEVLLELTSTADSFGFIAVYTIYNGQNPCTNSAAITLYNPSGTIFCDNAVDNNSNQVISRWFINPNNGQVALGVSYFYYQGLQAAVDASLAFFAGSQDTDPQLGLISPEPTPNGNTYYDPYAPSNPTTYNFRASAILVKFSSASNPSFFSMNYATTNLQCTTSGKTVFTAQDGTFGCTGLSADARKTYLISPTTQGESITLDFLYFRLQKGEAFFKIYEGTDATGKLRYSFTGHTIPPQIVIKSKSIFIDVDNSRTTSASGGYQVNYYVNSFCVVSKAIKVTAPTNNIACLPLREGVNSSVLIEPNLGPITFSWNILNFQGQWRLYDGSTIDAPILASDYGTRLDSATITPQSYTSTARTLLLVVINEQQQGVGLAPPVPSFGFSFTYTAAKRSAPLNENQESEALSIFANSGSYGSISWYPGVTSEYYIAPQNRGRISLTIDQLSLTDDDVVLIYDGPSQEYPLLTPIILAGTPKPTIPTSTGDSILIIVSTAKTSVSSDFTFSFTTLSNICYYIDPTKHSVTLTQKFGFFGCPNGIDNSVVAEWQISPNNGPVVLEFLFFAFEKDQDFLTIYDGLGTTGTKNLGTFTGYNITTIPNPITSTLEPGAFTVDVVTNSITLSQGFFAKWSTSDPCFITNTNTVLTTQTGSFGCFNGLATQITSTWLISPSNGTISLSFEKLNLNSLIVSGNYDSYITIYDGPDATGTVLAVVTGNILPPTIISSKTSMFVVLHTGNSADRNQGFIAEYFALGATDPCQTPTDLVLTAPSGVIQCLNGFGAGVVSSWFITPLDGIITFTNNKIGTENFNPAIGPGSGDTLAFYDGYSLTDPVFQLISDSNEKTISSFSSPGQTVLVVLSALSNNVISNGLFSYSYDAASSPCYKSTTRTYTQMSGTISCSNLGNNLDSSYTISPTGPNGPIAIDFSAFNFAPGDYLLIIEGISATGPVSATYTGTAIPPEYISQTDSVTIRIRTDSSIRSIGFTLTYTASNDPCQTSANIEYTDISRTFGCTSIGASVQSSWLITPGFGKTIDLALLSFGSILPGTTITVYGGSSVSGTPILTVNDLTPASPKYNQDTGFTSLYVTLSSTTASTGNFLFLYASGENDVCLVSGTSVLQQEQDTFGCFHQIDNNVHSSWLIQPTSGAVITLIAKIAGSGWDGGYDLINVYDGPSVGSPLTPVLDTDGETGTYTSTGGQLLVTLDTDGDTRSSGFSATYTTASTNYCLINQTSIAPITTFPGYIQCSVLGNNVYNKISLQAPLNSYIIFTPIDFITELNQDFVIIYDGSAVTDTEIARYSGLIVNGPQVVTSSRDAVVVIQTNSQNPSQLINLKYETTTDPCIVSGSSPAPYTASAGRFGCSQITAPNTNTQFKIQPASFDGSTQVIYLQFDDLYIPPGQGTINIYSGDTSGTLLATASGFNLPAPLKISNGLVTLQLNIQATSSFFVSYAVVSKTNPIPVVSVSPSLEFSKNVASVAPPVSGFDPSPTLRPSSTPSAPAREASNSPPPGASFPHIPSFEPYVPPTPDPSISMSRTKSPTPSISLSYTETRTATATPAATPSVSRSSEFFNIRTRFNCIQTVEQCCTDFSAFWAALSSLNAPVLVSPKICQAITARDTLVEVVFEQFGSNFFSVNDILNDYWAKAGCGNQDPIDDGVCVPSTSSLGSNDWDDVYLLEVVEEAQYTTDLNTSAAVETTYNPIDTTYQPVFTSSGNYLCPLVSVVILVVFSFL